MLSHPKGVSRKLPSTTAKYSQQTHTLYKSPPFPKWIPLPNSLRQKTPALSMTGPASFAIGTQSMACVTSRRRRSRRLLLPFPQAA